MTAKEIRQTLIAQMGNKEDGMNIYHQIQRSLKEDGKPLNSIWEIKITRNDYADPEEKDNDNKVVHISINGNGLYETCL